MYYPAAVARYCNSMQGYVLSEWLHRSRLEEHATTELGRFWLETSPHWAAGAAGSMLLYSLLRDNAVPYLKDMSMKSAGLASTAFVGGSLSLYELLPSQNASIEDVIANFGGAVIGIALAEGIERAFQKLKN